jgi:hypothetical protein
MMIVGGKFDSPSLSHFGDLSLPPKLKVSPAKTPPPITRPSPIPTTHVHNHNHNQ